MMSHSSRPAAAACAETPEKVTVAGDYDAAALVAQSDPTQRLVKSLRIAGVRVVVLYGENLYG